MNLPLTITSFPAARLLAITAGVVLAGAVMPVRGDEPPARLRPSHEALVAMQNRGPVIDGLDLRRLAPGQRLAQQDPGSLLARSTVIACDGYWTIVPKNAVLTVPPQFAERVGAEPRGTLLPWARFFERNRGWIHLQPVRMSDAAGETTLSEAILRTHRSLGRVVVAVLQNGPISVRPPTQSVASRGAISPTR